MLRPRFPEAENHLGVAFLELSNVDAAITAFERAVRLRPTLGPTHVSLAEIYLSRDDLKRALDHLEIAHALGEPISPVQLAALRQRVAHGEAVP